MLPKQRHTYGRSRTPSRGARRASPNAESAAAALALARRTACRFVAARWPDLAAVAPVATTRLPQPPSPELLARLGLRADEIRPAPDGAEYTFTFVGEIRSADGGCTPLVAAVTVDSRQRIIKTSISK